MLQPITVKLVLSALLLNPGRIKAETCQYSEKSIFLFKIVIIVMQSILDSFDCCVDCYTFLACRHCKKNYIRQNVALLVLFSKNISFFIFGEGLQRDQGRCAGRRSMRTLQISTVSRGWQTPGGSMKTSVWCVGRFECSQWRVMAGGLRWSKTVCPGVFF